MKKLGAGSTGKSGTGSLGKSLTGSSSKSGASSIGKSGTSKATGSKLTGAKTSSTGPKLSSGFGSSLGSSSKSSTTGGTTSKSFLPSYSTNKTKSSAGFGIIWIPTRKQNKHRKDVVYTSHSDAYPRGKYEKSPSMYGFGRMSGDSEFQSHKKKEEETDLLMPEKTKAPTSAIATVGAAAVLPEGPTDSNGNPEEKHEFIRHDKEETKEAAGDTNNTDFKDIKDDDYLSNDKVANKCDKRDSKDRYEDKVDSVYLRPPPPHKARSNPSIAEEDGCGIKCLYYTLQCCDCVLQ